MRELGIFSRVYCVTGPMNIILIKLGVLRERVAKWWGHSPLNNVAQVRILASTPYGGWVCCWFSPLLLEVFLRVLRFPSSLKPTLANSNSIWNLQTRFNEFIWTSKCSVGTNDNFSFKANIPSSHRSFCFSGLFRRVFLSSVLKRTRGREKRDNQSLYI